MGIMLAKPITEKETQRETSADGLIEFGASAMQGWRVDMEDDHTITPNCEGLEGHSFVAVYDGHGGALAAKYAGKKMMEHITETQDFKDYQKGKNTKDLEEAMRKAFLSADEAIRDEQKKSEGGDRSGCTAIVMFITPSHLVLAHAGDSRAVLVSDGQVTDHTIDHKPNNPQERERITKAGGYVSMKRVDGDLAVSRALGDFQYKDEKLPAEDRKVTAVPDTKTIPRTSKDEFLVVACDGIWDVMTNEECARAVSDIYEEGEEDVGLVCEEVLDMCLDKRSRDNMSVVLVTFQALKKGNGGGVELRRSTREKEAEEVNDEIVNQDDQDQPQSDTPGK